MSFWPWNREILAELAKIEKKQDAILALLNGEAPDLGPLTDKLTEDATKIQKALDSAPIP